MRKRRMLAELRHTDDKALPALALELATLKREWAYWNFRRKWCGNKSKLPHDLICITNNPAR